MKILISNVKDFEVTKMKWISIILFIILPFFVFHFSGCSLSPQTNSPSKIPRIADNTANVADQNFLKRWREQYDASFAELERNQQIWQESKIKNYDFVIAKYAGGQTSSWNRMPVLIKIREGEKVSLEKVEKDKDYVYSSRTDGFEDIDTIDKLFDYLRQELDDRNILNVEYDKNYGYPKSVSITFTSYTNHNWRVIEISKLELVK